MNYFKFEDKILKWINTHKFIWCFILFGLGVGLSVLQNSLLKAESSKYVSNSFLYGGLLIIVELTTQGESKW